MIYRRAKLLDQWPEANALLIVLLAGRSVSTILVKGNVCAQKYLCRLLCLWFLCSFYDCICCAKINRHLKKRGLLEESVYCFFYRRFPSDMVTKTFFPLCSVEGIFVQRVNICPFPYPPSSTEDISMYIGFLFVSRLEFLNFQVA